MHIYKSSIMIKLKDGFSGERALVLPQSIVTRDGERRAFINPAHYGHRLLPEGPASFP